MMSEPAGTPAGRLPGRDHEFVRLVTRFVVAQAVAVAAVGLPFSRRHLSSILISLGLVVAVCGLVLLVRSGTRSAWLIAVSFEATFFVYGFSRFVLARYVGGTLFALIAVGALLHPAVARAYGVRWGHGDDGAPQQAELGDAAGETLGGSSAG